MSMSFISETTNCTEQLAYPRRQISTSKGSVKPVLSDHIKQDIFLAFQTGGCLLLPESSAEGSCMSCMHYFRSAISNHLSIAISMSPKWMVAYNSAFLHVSDLNFKPLHHENKSV